MTTLLEWLNDKSEGEEIEGVILGERPLDCKWPQYPLLKLMKLEEAMPYLTIEFVCDFGSPEHPPMHAWTKSWVIGTSVYDGFTTAFRIPRNPKDCDVCQPGGG